MAKESALNTVEPNDAAGIVERLGDPVLIIAGDRTDAASRAIVSANAAARSLFRIVREHTALTSVLRNPSVLDAIDGAFRGEDAQAVYETGGAQPRWWRALAQPLDAARVLLILHDETDARRNERMRADFLANASHELRTPLASLVGFVETLRGHARDDPEARERFLAIMAGQAGRMSRLIDDLLSLSRVEMNEHIAPEGTVDIAANVQDMLNAAAPLLAARSVNTEPKLARGTAASGDRDQIMQVMQNLFDNAVKYSPPGGTVVVEVSHKASAEDEAAPALEGAARLSLLTPDRSDGGFVALRISDQGPGIARGNLPRLSERFYRVEGQKSGEREGTGLGLAIVKHIINRHRGGLTVESAEGKGTTFTAYFPSARLS